MLSRDVRLVALTDAPPTEVPAAPVDVHGVELVTGRDVTGDLQVPAGGVAVVRES